MKNWEKYEEELKKTGFSFAVTRNSVATCAYAKCSDCAFNKRIGDCDIHRMKWLYSDYEEPQQKLTKEEKSLIDCLPCEDYSIMRYSDGTACVFNPHPIGGNEVQIRSDLFPFITEDNDWSITELKELEVEE